MAALVIKKEQRTVQYFREQLGKDIELESILVPGGKFLMGSPDTEENHENDESPQHLVTIQSFFLGRYPVTQEQWQIVAETYEQVNIDLPPQPSHFKGAKLPVERVNWHEAKEYADRLTKHFKRPYRLPTEAEWEYACRAGTTTPFYFGSTLSTELVNYDGNFIYGNGVKGEYRKTTTPIDYFKIANDWGLCDMHGNVREWCEDHWHDNYKGAPENGSAWLTDDPDARRVNRGGSWIYSPWFCRSAVRYFFNPTIRDYYLGLRMAVGAPGLF